MAFIIFGDAVFSSPNRRDAVMRQWDRTASRGGFTPNSELSPRIPAGIATFTYVVPEDGPDGPAGTLFSGFTFCYAHPDRAIVQLAESEMAQAMQGGGWVAGSYGTWDSGVYA